MARTAVTDRPFTLADRVTQDAALAMHYAGQVAMWRRQAADGGSNFRRFQSYARAAEKRVVLCATRIEVRLQLLDDQRASA